MTETTQAPAALPMYRMAIIDADSGRHVMVPATSATTELHDPWQSTYGAEGLVEPRYSPIRLLGVMESSDALAPVVDAYTTMVEGTGTYPERYKPDGAAPLDADEEELQRQHAMVMDVIARFDPMDPIEMRRTSRAHMLLTGFRGFEVVRDKTGQIAYLNHVSSAYLRATKLDRTVVDTAWPRRDPMTGAWLEGDAAHTRGRRFRRWVFGDTTTSGVVGNRVWFKEFGDPRHYDQATGQEIAEASVAAHIEKGGRLANEIIVQVTTTDPFGSPYGVPATAAIHYAIDGNLEAAKVNFKAFADGFRTPLLITIVGGFFTDKDMERVKEQIDEHKGSSNFGVPLVLSVEKDTAPAMGLGTPGQLGTPVITVTKLRDVFPEDHTHEKYQDRNDRKIGQRLRLPPVFRGATEGEYTFATIWASLWVFEKTVGSLERRRTDDIINRMWLPELGIHLYEAKTRGIPVADLSELKGILDTLVDAGVVTPDEVRAIAAQMADLQLDPLGDGGWSDTPLGLLKAPAAVPADPAAEEPEDPEDTEDPEDAADPKKAGKKNAEPDPDPEDDDAAQREQMRQLRMHAIQRRMKPRGLALGSLAG